MTLTKEDLVSAIEAIEQERSKNPTIPINWSTLVTGLLSMAIVGLFASFVSNNNSLSQVRSSNDILKENINDIRGDMKEMSSYMERVANSVSNIERTSLTDEDWDQRIDPVQSRLHVMEQERQILWKSLRHIESEVGKHGIQLNQVEEQIKNGIR